MPSKYSLEIVRKAIDKSRIEMCSYFSDGKLFTVNLEVAIAESIDAQIRKDAEIANRCMNENNETIRNAILFQIIDKQLEE